MRSAEPRLLRRQDVDVHDLTGHFKPGLDFADDGPDRQGQATLLRTFARSHDVKMVVVGIGGNDFDFARP